MYASTCIFIHFNSFQGHTRYALYSIYIKSTTIMTVPVKCAPSNALLTSCYLPARSIYDSFHLIIQQTNVMRKRNSPL